jgi:non-lysosomal glucosylceramidase
VRRDGPSERLSIPTRAWSRPLGSAAAAPGRPRVTHEPLIDDGPWGGVPLGGLGSGSIGRTPRGDFARWHLDTGRHVFEPVPACNFSVFTSGPGASHATVLSTLRPAGLPTWGWDLPEGAGTYHGLFPDAWFEYDHAPIPVRLAQRQWSPVIPGEYRASGWPVALFDWEIENPAAEPATVGLLFTWQNLVGHWAGEDRRGGARNRLLRRPGLTGVVLDGPPVEGEPAWAGSFAIAAEAAPGVEVTVRTRFDTDDGADIWTDFADDGRLDDVADETPGRPGETIGAGVAATVRLQPGERRSVTFALAWDLPTVEFGAGRRWRRRYTRDFGTTGRAAGELVEAALRERHGWRASIDGWHAAVLDRPGRPAWFGPALLNELYYLVDGGTFWAAHELDGSSADEIGPFAVLECFDYPFYNTLDVYFYASFALALLWPRLAVRLVRDFIATVDVDDPEEVPVYATGGRTVRKVAGALPHDVGGPADDPFAKLNHYHLRDVNVWKDLNPKFVLLVWQAIALCDADELAVPAWPSVLRAMRTLAAADHDGDGLPEHDGTPDQTYDTWPMRGPSAYGGSLWIAALHAAVEIGTRAGDTAGVAWLRGILDRAVPAFDRTLWNGTWYRYDAGGDASSDSIMADQLAGQWWADATGLPAVAPAPRVDLALRTIFRTNVLGFGGGRMGAVNGMRPTGELDASSEQSQEVWTGTAYALAAFMIHRGLVAEAWTTAGGVDAVLEARGMRYRTPEAYDIDGNYRASLYLRPLAIWAIEHALRTTHA